MKHYLTYDIETAQMRLSTAPVAGKPSWECAPGVADAFERLGSNLRIRVRNGIATMTEEDVANAEHMDRMEAGWSDAMEQQEIDRLEMWS